MLGVASEEETLRLYKGWDTVSSVAGFVFTMSV